MRGSSNLLQLSFRGSASRKRKFAGGEKKFLTNGIRFDILNKLLLRRQRSEKLRICFEPIENLQKRSKKVLDKRNLF